MNEKPRTIDDFYNQAHDGTTKQHFFALCSERLSYFMIFVALGIANIGDAAEIGSMGFLLANDSFLTEVANRHEGIVVSSLYSGMLIGGLIAGPLCDHTGRRAVLLHGLLLNSTFGAATALSAHLWQLIVCRFLMGMGIGAVVSCLLALTSEHTPSKHRGKYLNFVSAFWTVGSIYVALMAMLLFGKFDRSWRLYILINAIPSIISFGLVVCFVPESARFLALHGKHVKAAAIANIVAQSMGFEGKPLSSDEIRSHYGEPALSDKNSYWATFAKTFQSFQSVYRKSSRLRIIGVQLLWFFVSFASGVCIWIARVFRELSFVNHIYTMTLFFALASVPGVFIAGFILDRVGRTALLTVSIAFTMISLLVFALLSLYSSMAWAVVLAACIFHSSLVVSWSSLSVVTAEVFPTRTRSTAMGLCAGTGRFASIIVHLVSAPLIDADDPTVILFMGAGSLLLAVGVSMGTGLQNKTGKPLADDDSEQKKREKIEPPKHEKSGSVQVA